MTNKERYYWDLNGHLVVRNVLSAKELKAANDAIDYLADRCANGTDEESDFLRENAQPSWMGETLTRTRNSYPYLLRMKAPHCEPYRKMVAHPQVISRLRVMCGEGFRLDHGPQFIGGLPGIKNHHLHGSGEPHKPYVAYSNQSGNPYVGGVTVTYALGDSGPEDGGFACVPGSHKSKYSMPAGVRTFEDDMGVVAKPNVKAGDVIFFMDGAQTHGARAWRAKHERRAILLKFASRTSTRSGVSRRFLEPDTYWDKNIVDGMTAEQRAVMYGPASNGRSQDCQLDVDTAGAVRIASRS
jgi:ectoine hydroxylase-related dioxygenase (phytanoyl-CoA dioxygenase family)